MEMASEANQKPRLHERSHPGQKLGLGHALRVLEFDKILERLAEQCETPLSANLAREIEPRFVAEEVWSLLEETKEAYDLLATDPPPSLSALRDPRDQLRLASKGAVLEAADLFRCMECLGTQRRLKAYLKGKPSAKRLGWFAEALADQPRLEERLGLSLGPDGEVLDGASPALAQLRAKKAAASARIVERIQAYVSGRTRELLSDAVYTVRDGRFVLPLKAENRGKIKGIVHDTSSSGATIYVEPEDVLNLGNALREAEAAERAEVRRILADLSTKVGAVATEVIGGVEAASAVDLVLSRGRFAYVSRGSMPYRLNQPGIKLESAKHPLLEQEKAVPSSLFVGQGSSVLITGPNTGGKTVAIKTVGLAVAMAQSGLFPVALEVAIGPFSGLWADIGDEQSLQQSLSTFSGHVKNIAEALRSMSPGSLMLFDEIGAGTDPAEGSALAVALLNTMAAAGCAILASTHYGELKQFAYETPGFTNAAMEFDVKTLQPTYRLLMGSPGASQALRIAERHGIPKAVIDLAREGLGQQTQNLSQMMEELDRAQKLARTAQSEADRRLTELRRTQEEAAKKLAEAEEIRTTVRKRAAETIELALREIRLEAAKIFDDLKRDPSREGLERARQQLKDLQSVGTEFATELGPKVVKSAPARSRNFKLTKGLSVRVDGYPQVGQLVAEPTGKTAQVQMGVLKLTVPVEKVTPANPADIEKIPSAKAGKNNLGLARAQSASTEIHLRMMRAEAAEEDLSKFLDDAVLAGLPSVRIVHGKGEGVLRQLTQRMLRRHPDVKSFRDGEPGEGGQGVTIAVFR
jgi:DNA mismatch repair protein MutS2